VSAEDRALYGQLIDGLRRYESEVALLPGIASDAARETFVRQVVASDRRVRYFTMLGSRPVSARRSDPGDPLFDPIRAAVWFRDGGDFDEACWMVFWFVHCGRNRITSYRLAQDVYGRLGANPPWSWALSLSDPASFEIWLATNAAEIKRRGGRFGNHRKYESLADTGLVVSSYLSWTVDSHASVFDGAIAATASPEEAFDRLYRSMTSVYRFGRVARFDYLSTLGRLGLAQIRPGRSYLSSSTGPVQGARLLYAAPSLQPRELESKLLASRIRCG
jgi:hypothetical protein